MGHTLGVDLLPIRKVQVEGHEAERVQTIPHVQEPLDIPGGQHVRKEQFTKHGLVQVQHADGLFGLEVLHRADTDQCRHRGVHFLHVDIPARDGVVDLFPGGAGGVADGIGELIALRPNETGGLKRIHGEHGFGPFLDSRVAPSRDDVFSAHACSHQG